MLSILVGAAFILAGLGWFVLANIAPGFATAPSRKEAIVWFKKSLWGLAVAGLGVALIWFR